MDKQRSPALEHDGDWSAEFQAQRRRAWRKARWAVRILASSFAAVLWDMRFFFVGFLGGAGSILWLVFVCTRYYLCPACGKMPMTSGTAFGPDGYSHERGVALDREFCSTAACA